MTFLNNYFYFLEMYTLVHVGDTNIKVSEFQYFHSYCYLVKKLLI